MHLNNVEFFFLVTLSLFLRIGTASLIFILFSEKNSETGRHLNSLWHTFL